MTDQRLYLGPLTDSRRWMQITLRPDDIIVAAPPKCGTTWVQTMIALLLSGDPTIVPELPIRMPWVDIRLRDIEEVATRIEAMTHRRCLKTHTPLDGLPVPVPGAGAGQAICLFRHPLDAHFSYRKHLANIPITWFDHWYPQGDTDGTTFRRFLDGGPEGFDGDAMPLAHILRHYQAARALADRPNVTLLHYADMVRDPRRALDHLAALLGADHSAAVMDSLAQAASFGHMQAHADRYAPGGGTGFYKSDRAFFDSASSGKWDGQLSAAELAAYDAAMDAALSQQDRAWLEFGNIR